MEDDHLMNYLQKMIEHWPAMALTFCILLWKISKTEFAPGFALMDSRNLKSIIA